MSEYPESWVTMALSDAVINVAITDKKIPQKEYLSEGVYPVFDQGQEFIGGYTDKREKLVECELPVIVFGDHTRAIKFVNQPFAAGADGVKVLQPKCLYIPRLFEYFSLHLATHLTSHGYARHYQHLAKSIIPLPPTNEQYRIVAKIEALFSELDKGIESFKTAREQLKIYRQALLKHAFSGKLTKQWRAENAGKLESAEALLKRIENERQQRYQQQLKDWEANGKQGSKPKAPKTLPPLTAEELAELSELPEEWATIKIDGILSLEKKPMSTGPFGTALKKSEHRSIGIPVLGIENIGNGVFLYGNKIFVSEEKGKELESFSVEANDIVISRSGTVGEICKVPDSLGKAYISTNLIRVSLNQKVINPDFFVYLFQSGSFVKEQVKNLCKGSSREFLNQTILSSLVFPLPSLEEQYQIVSEIDSRTSMVDQLDQTINAALEQTEALRQSILKQAFSGQLVPQDPNDEPAYVLLERIQVEKTTQAAQSKPKKTLKRKATA